MRLQRCAGLILLAIALPVGGRAEGEGKSQNAAEVKLLTRRMQAFYEKTSSFSASFKQEYVYKSFNRTQTSTGKVFFLRPGMMRWDYEKPSPKSFVLTGDKIYAYDAEAMTFTIAPFDSSQLSAAVTFLWGRGRLEKEFRIDDAPCASCQGMLLELTPLAPDSRFQKIRLEVDRKTAQVLKSTVVDPDGSENRISFFDLKANQKIDPGMFKLTPPANAQVVDMTKSSR